MVLPILGIALVAAVAPDTKRDWGEALKTDATALHDEIAHNHPGPVNPADPGFAARNDAQYKKTLKRAANANSFEHYFYAIKEYTASFNDGHMGFGVYGNTPDEVRAWPGFLTRYDAKGQQFVSVSEAWSGVPRGARLVSCDGLTADQVADRRMGSRFGRWNLNAQRQFFGAMTFLDTGNPYVGTIGKCTFSAAGQTFTVALQWRKPEGNLYDKYELFGPSSKRSFRRARLADGTAWFSLPSFYGNPDSEAGKALRELIAYLDASGDDVRAAKSIVLDLRGNGGGSSDWSYQIAKRIWGEGAIERHPEEPMTVRWRASIANLGSIKEALAQRSKGGNMTAETTAFYRDTITGLERALARHQALWTIRPEKRAPMASRVAGQSYRLRGPVYVLTDSNCMSACLDAVDLWTRLGAIPVGHETGADTLYMEVRQARLPSGIGAISMPMKVYSGRSRGSNQPVVPRHVYLGNITDTSALEHWVASLPEQGGTGRR